MQTLKATLYLLLLAGSTAAQAWMWHLALPGPRTAPLLAAMCANYALLVFLYVILGLILHEAAHGHLGPRPVNDAFGHVSAALLLFSYSFFRHLHWTHHGGAYLPSDIELLSENPGHVASRGRRRTLLRLMLLGGTERGRSYQALLRNPKVPLSRELRRHAVVEIVLSHVLVVGTGALWIWQMGALPWLCCYLLPAWTGAWIFTWIQLCEHYGLRPGPEPECSRDVIPRNYAQALLYRAMFNVNYHGVHHERPEIPSMRLPEAHQLWVRELALAGKPLPPAYGSYREIVREILPRLIVDCRR